MTECVQIVHLGIKILLKIDNIVTEIYSKGRTYNAKFLFILKVLQQ